MITNTGMRRRARHSAIVPALGVVPPSIRLSHSSTRLAPPASAATAEGTESTQASMRTFMPGPPPSRRRYREFTLQVALARLGGCAQLLGSAQGRVRAARLAAGLVCPRQLIVQAAVLVGVARRLEMREGPGRISGEHPRPAERRPGRQETGICGER